MTLYLNTDFENSKATLALLCVRKPKLNCSFNNYTGMRLN